MTHITHFCMIFQIRHKGSYFYNTNLTMHFYKSLSSEFCSGKVLCNSKTEKAAPTEQPFMYLLLPDRLFKTHTQSRDSYIHYTS